MGLDGDGPCWVSDKVASEEIGPDEIKKLKFLRFWLYCRDPDYSPRSEIRFRVAPSIIARSECELLGVSFPRFAFRAYLTPDCRHSFVNARRIQRLIEVAPAWSKRLNGASHPSETVVPDDEFANTFSVADIIKQRSTCVADSLLVPPKRFCSGFHILTVELGRAYGEVVGDDRGLRATPFVKHMRFAGGMCAQAGCFIATAILHNAAKGIFGVPEITALTQRHGADELVLGGMTPSNVVSYFRHPSVGLWSSCQTTALVTAGPPGPPGPGDDPRARELLLTHLCSRVLHSYVMSGMPVIVPTDYGRMNGEGVPIEDSIYGCNDLTDHREQPQSEDPRRHCVVVVGCHNSHPLEFVIHDPAKMPFMVASARQLMQARPYLQMRDGGEGPISSLERDLTLLPVTPGMVRLPLLNTKEEQPTGERRFYFGLLSIARSVQNKMLQQRGSAVDAPDDTGTFRLALVGGELGLQAAENGDLSAIPDGVGAALAKKTDRELWCWVQYKRSAREGGGREMVWVWDATLESPGLGDTADPEFVRGKYLVAELIRNDEGWACKLERTASGPASQRSGANETTAATCCGQVAPSLISSFTTLPFVAACQAWPADPSPACELYAFMQPEIDGFVKRLGVSRKGRTAMEFMADLAGDHAAIKRVGDDIAEKANAAKIREISSLASFLPELAHAFGSMPAKLARRATVFLGRLAGELQERGFGTRVIELVSGSLMSGIWPGLPSDNALARQMIEEKKRRFVANRTSDEVARGRLIDNLGWALAGLERLDKCAAPDLRQLDEDAAPLRWVVELEPGPLFVVRDWQTLFAFCGDLANCGDTMRNVGVNLDIAHWRLASRQAADPSNEITADKVRREPVVFHRVFHGHIAGHHPGGHFGDIPLDSLNDLQKDFGPWVALLRERSALKSDDGTIPPYSGVISVEIEATREFGFASRSVRVLEDLLLS